MMGELAKREGIREMAAFHPRLRQLMLERSLEIGKQIRQKEVSEESGVSLATIQRWYDPEYTFNRVDAETLYRLLDYFGCKFEDLIERAESDE